MQSYIVKVAIRTITNLCWSAERDRQQLRQLRSALDAFIAGDFRAIPADLIPEIVREMYRQHFVADEGMETAPRGQARREIVQELLRLGLVPPPDLRWCFHIVSSTELLHAAV